MSKPTETRSYRQLRRTVASLLEEGRERARQAVERERAITYWRVGEVIHTHALGAARRAPFGDGAMKRLAKDVGVPQQRLYEALKFYRCFPIFRTSGKLTWSHYLGLLKLPSEEARRYYEQAAIDGCWSVKELVEKIEDRTYARHLEPVATVPDSAKPLVAQRGEIGLYRVKQPPGQKRSGLFLDLGFGHFWSLGTTVGKSTVTRDRFKEGDLVRARQRSDGAWTIVRAEDATSRRLFTHVMSVARVVDGDTLTVTMTLPSGDVLYDRLRLRGIDTPEMQTKAGQRAKTFVEDRLGGCEFIVVKTLKTPGRYGRYIADVYYDAEERVVKS